MARWTAAKNPLPQSASPPQLWIPLTRYFAPRPISAARMRPYSDSAGTRIAQQSAAVALNLVISQCLRLADTSTPGSQRLRFAHQANGSLRPLGLPGASDPMPPTPRDKQLVS